MRVTAMVAGAALMLAACGGKTDKTTSTDTTHMAAPPPAGGMAAGGGATHTIEMVMLSANSYKFQPENTTIKAGDTVIFKGVSGLSHDVAFIEDSIPPGAKAVLQAAVTGGPQDMATAMIPDGQSVSVSFAGAPAGTYHFYCIPHMPMGMRGSITVQ